MEKIIVTGGMGFIGSNLIRELILKNYIVLNIDIVTSSSTQDTLKDIKNHKNYFFAHVDIRNYAQLQNVIEEFLPDKIIHLAAESHVDNSIDSPKIFVETNIIGTFNILDISNKYWIKNKRSSNFLFHHVSTDEVYGDLVNSGDLFTEQTSYFPSSPYAASKASSDHLVRAWYRTYNFPSIVTNCSNNYGPYQFPEKFIPHMILNAMKGKSLPIYGNGLQVRDWLNVKDHAKALIKVLNNGKIGETYNIGGLNEKTNLHVVGTICKFLEELAPDKPQGVQNYNELITFVKDRPGHDTRYAIDASKIIKELDWRPIENFETGLYKTVKWYLENQEWWKKILDGPYNLQRVGLKKKQ
jgi:dTDP-glucose 4,6-dehydratase